MKTWMTDGFEKVLGSDPGPERSIMTHTVYMAKNETEACQISLRSEEEQKGIRLEPFGDLPAGITVTLYEVTSLRIRGEEWPDPLKPLPAAFDLEAGRTRSIFIQVRSSADTPAGEHPLYFTLRRADGMILHDYCVTAHVWDFSYPVPPHMGAVMGLCKVSLAYHCGFIKGDVHKASVPPEAEEEVDRIYKAVFDLLLDYKIVGFDLPYPILDDRADAYLDDPRVKYVYVLHTQDEETIYKIYDKLCSKEEWIRKAYFYPVDEPTSKEMMDDIREKAERMRRRCPRFQYATAYFCNYSYDENTDETAFLADILDILCIKVMCWNDDAFYSEEQKRKYPPMMQRTRQLQKERGKHIWSYVCWEPGDPYTNLYVNESGLNHRILFWQQYMVGSECFLYWCANYWKCVSDTWANMMTVPWLSNDIYGDGSLLYSGRQVGVYGACPSKRLDCVRDGIEDYELLTMAAEVLGEDYVKEQMGRAVTDITHYTKDAALFSALRKKIGCDIEKKLKG